MNQQRGIIFGIVSLAVVVAVVLLIGSRTEQQTSESEPVLQDGIGPQISPITANELKELIRSRGSKLTIVNLWASFCVPCREEFPFLLKAYEEYRDQGVDLILVTMDFKSEVGEARDFLIEQRVDFETFIKSEKDEDFIQALYPEWSGIIPTTIIYNAAAQPIYFLPKALTFEELEEKIVSGLAQK